MSIENEKSKNKNMHKGAKKEIFRNAFRLRGNTNEVENLLWEKLKNNQLGYRFRRQHPVSSYVADFYCHKKSLIIEVDEKHHNNKKQKELDKQRTEYLELLGLKVIRFTDTEVFDNIEYVLDKIIVQLNK